jgi:hypothetical protein
MGKRENQFMNKLQKRIFQNILNKGEKMRRSIFLKALTMLGLEMIDSYDFLLLSTGIGRNFTKSKNKASKGKKHKSQKIRANRRKAKRKRK